MGQNIQIAACCCIPSHDYSFIVGSLTDREESGKRNNTETENKQANRNRKRKQKKNTGALTGSRTRAIRLEGEDHTVRQLTHNNH